MNRNTVKMFCNSWNELWDTIPFVVNHTSTVLTQSRIPILLNLCVHGVITNYQTSRFSDPFWIVSWQSLLNSPYLQSHWKVQPHWKTTETTLKRCTNDNHTEIFSVITLKFVCYCYPRMLILYNPTQYFQRYISFVLSIFSVTLVFQCDFQCHILIVIPTPHCPNYWHVFKGYLVSHKHRKR